MSEQARVQVEARGILVGCSANATQLALDSKQELRDQVSSAVFAHERQCGQCDTTAAYEQGSPGFLKSIEAARSMQDQMDEKGADNERRGD